MQDHHKHLGFLKQRAIQFSKAFHRHRISNKLQRMNKCVKQTFNNSKIIKVIQTVRWILEATSQIKLIEIRLSIMRWCLRKKVLNKLKNQKAQKMKKKKWMILKRLIVKVKQLLIMKKRLITMKMITWQIINGNQPTKRMNNSQTLYLR